MFVSKSSKGEIATLLTLISVGLMLLGTIVGSYVAQRETKVRSNASGVHFCGKMNNGQDCNSNDDGSQRFCYNECLLDRGGYSQEVFCNSQGYVRGKINADPYCPLTTITPTINPDCAITGAWICQWPDNSWKNCLAPGTDKQGLFERTYCPGPDNKGPELMWKYQAAKAHNPTGDGKECQGELQLLISGGCGTPTPTPPSVNSPTPTNTPVPNQPPTNTPIPNQPTYTPIPNQPTNTPIPSATPTPRSRGPVLPTNTPTSTPINIPPAGSTATPTITINAPTDTQKPPTNTPILPTYTVAPTPTLEAEKCIVDADNSNQYTIAKDQSYCKLIDEQTNPIFPITRKVEIKKTCQGNNKWIEENCTDRGMSCFQDNGQYNARCSQKCDLLQGSGDRTSKYDLLILADKYSNMSEFLVDAKEAVNRVNKTNLGKNLIDKINFWVLQEVSETYTDDSVDNNITGDAYANKLPSKLSMCGADGFMIIKNTGNGFGYSVGFNTSVVSKAWLKTHTAPHELGHGMVGLMDEYDGNAGNGMGGSGKWLPNVINCSTETSSLPVIPCPKWKDRYQQGEVGCIPVCYYNNYYRPTLDSVMNATYAGTAEDTYDFNRPSLDAWNQALQKYQ